MIQIPTDKAQQLWGKLRNRLQRQEIDYAKLIQRGSNFKGMLDNAGYKDLQEWMVSQQALITKVMTEGVRPDNEKGLSRLEVYNNLQRDYEVFNRIRAYVERSIRAGDEARQKLALKEEQREKHEKKQQ